MNCSSRLSIAFKLKEKLQNKSSLKNSARMPTFDCLSSENTFSQLLVKAKTPKFLSGEGLNLTSIRKAAPMTSVLLMDFMRTSSIGSTISTNLSPHRSNSRT